MTNERISAWIDGEAQENAAPADAAAREACAVWWLIGDVMRREKALPPDFSARVMRALEAEPTVLAPRVRQAVAASASTNMPGWMPVAAAVAGVAVAAWAVLGARSGSLPQESSSVVVAKSQPAERPGLSLVRSPAADDDTRAYLLAHQANGRGVQMAGVSGYVRPVSFDQGLVAASR